MDTLYIKKCIKYRNVNKIYAVHEQSIINKQINSAVSITSIPKARLLIFSFSSRNQGK